MQLPEDPFQERPRLQSTDFMDDDLTRSGAPAGDLTLQISPPMRDYSRKRGHVTEKAPAKRRRLSLEEFPESLPHEEEQIDVDPQQEISTSVTLPEMTFPEPELIPFLGEVIPNVQDELIPNVPDESSEREPIPTEDGTMPHPSVLASPSTSLREMAMSPPKSPLL